MNVPSDLRNHLSQAEQSAREEKLIELPAILDGTAAALALAGNVDAALELWMLMRDPRLPSDAGTAFGCGSISAVCHVTSRTDVSEGSPPPSWTKNEGVHPSLVVRVERHQDWLYGRLRRSAWSGSPSAPRSEKPDEGFRSDVTRYEDALSMLNEDESAAIDTLRALARESRLPGYTRLEMRLLAIDFDARHGRLEAADRELLEWYELAREGGRTDAHTPLGLLAVARRIIAGVLTEASGVGLEEGARAAAAIVQLVRGRLDTGEEINPARSSYRVQSSYGFFCLEPLVASIETPYFEEPEESERGFSLFDDHVAIGIPDVREADVELTVVDIMPPNPGRTFSFRATGDVYLRIVEDDRDTCRFAIPAGRFRAGVFSRLIDDELIEVRVALVPET